VDDISSSAASHLVPAFLALAFVLLFRQGDWPRSVGMITLLATLTASLCCFVLTLALAAVSGQLNPSAFAEPMWWTSGFGELLGRWFVIYYATRLGLWFQKRSLGRYLPFALLLFLSLFIVVLFFGTVLLLFVLLFVWASAP